MDSEKSAKSQDNMQQKCAFVLEGNLLNVIMIKMNIKLNIMFIQKLDFRSLIKGDIKIINSLLGEGMYQ